MEKLSTRLKLLRSEKDVKQKDVAKFLDISPSAYGFYEQDKRTPTPDMVLKLAEYFDVSTDFILGKSDNRKETKKEINANQSKDLEEEIEKVINDKNIQFCGTPLGDEDMKFLRDSLRATLEYAKAIKNKK